MGAVMDGEATPAQLAALLMGLRMRGETVDELAGFATRDARAGASASRRPTARSTSSGPAATAAGRSTSRRPRRSSPRRPACRSPSTATGRSRRRRARPTSSMRSASGSTTTRPRPAPRCATHRLRVPVRAELPPGDAARRPDPARDRRPDRVQPARAADQPGRHDAAAARASATRPSPSGWPRSSAGSARSGRSSSTATASTSCRSTAAASLYDRDRRRRSSGMSSMPRRSGFKRAATRTAGRRRRPTRTRG